MTDALVPTAEALPTDVLDRLRRGTHDARGTMAPETVRALRRAWGAFLRWCAGRGVPPLPADAGAVAEYVDALAETPRRKAAGIRQAAWAIGRMHRLAGCPDPTAAEPVRQALKRAAKALGTRQSQAAPLGEYEVRRIAEAAGTRPAELRDLALVLVMRDLLARRSEAVALDVADLAHDSDGSATALIRRSKTDQTGEGAVLYLSPPAADAVRAWLDAAAIREGAIFRAVNKAGRVGRRLQPGEVPRIVKRLALRAGIKPEVAEGLSGHSARVGMAQDLVAAGADLAGVMQAGRWKSPTMPARYTAALEAKRGAVAQFHARRGKGF